MRGRNYKKIEFMKLKSTIQLKNSLEGLNHRSEQAGDRNNKLLNIGQLNSGSLRSKNLKQRKKDAS